MTWAGGRGGGRVVEVGRDITSGLLFSPRFQGGEAPQPPSLPSHWDPYLPSRLTPPCFRAIWARGKTPLQPLGSVACFPLQPDTKGPVRLRLPDVCICMASDLLHTLPPVQPSFISNPLI